MRAVIGSFVALAISMLSTTAAAQQSATTGQAAPNMAADSGLVRSLLAEATGAALLAAPRDRVRLLERIARMQIEFGDALAAERAARTIATATAQSTEGLAIARSLRLDATCRLLEDRRVEEAIGVVLRIEDEHERGWPLARLSAQLVQLPRRTSGLPPDSPESLARHAARALELAHAVPAPDARVDALLAIAGRTRTHAPEVAAVASRSIERTLDELQDGDHRDSRRAQFVVLLTGLRAFDRAREHFDRVRDWRDLEYIAWQISSAELPESASATAHSGLERLREHVLTVTIQEAKAISDRDARWVALSGLRESIVRAGHESLAERLVPRRLIESTDPREHGPLTPDSAMPSGVGGRVYSTVSPQPQSPETRQALAELDTAAKLRFAGDTVQARAKLLSLLDRFGDLPWEKQQAPLIQLELLGARADALQWARSRSDPALRAAALRAAAEGIRFPLLFATGVTISNGPDSCRGEF